ncbi:PEP-CTERM sorting domain-containing protein [Akkermansiaceae bacterium]|nr:PEP-CTERM sorting domain-containing protein [Akkermansiaceae bacterium]
MTNYFFPLFGHATILILEVASGKGASGGLVGSGAGDIDGVGLWSRRPGATMNLDNLEIRDTAFNGASGAPEPSSVSLLGLGALSLLRRSR